MSLLNTTTPSVTTTVTSTPSSTAVPTTNTSVNGNSVVKFSDLDIVQLLFVVTLTSSYWTDIGAGGKVRYILSQGKAITDQNDIDAFNSILNLFNKVLNGTTLTKDQLDTMRSNITSNIQMP